VAISSPGIGSGLDVNSIVSKLMSVESLPLQILAQQQQSYQSKISAFGSLSGALISFQSAANSLSSPSTFQSMNASPGDSSILTASATAKAVPGSYNINVTQLAQAQTITSAGQTSASSPIGIGTSTTVNLQFGSISGGSVTSSGAKLSSAAAAGGIGANSLSINGTTIVTSSATTSANALASQINLLTSTTGVTATVQATDSGTLGAFTTTSGAATYTLDVGGVNIISSGAIGTTAADIDTALSSASAALTTAGITFTGTAAAGSLKFAKADGSNITVQESGAGAVGGFTTSIGATTKTFTSQVSLSSATAITVAGSNPALAGFNPGILPITYSGATFVQDATQASGAITIDSSNNSLQGIRDAINKANLGVTASIIADGSGTPYHLVLTSNKTGVTSSLKISVNPGGDTAVGNLLAYDPAGTQNFTQSSAAQNSALTVNGIAISSTTSSVSEAIQGTTLNLTKIGATSLNVALNSSAVNSAVGALVAAYNSLNQTLTGLTSYNATTQQAGLLLGDATARQVQTKIRDMLSSTLTGSNGNLTNLSQVGISIDKTGTMSLDSTKLQAALSTNANDVSALFATVGTATDSLVSVASSTSATQAGTRAISVTALATQGKAVGSAAAGLTITSGSNDELALTIDGVSATVTLQAGTYTAATLAAQVQSAITGSSTFTSAGIGVTASADVNGVMTITSNLYGSASLVNVSGNGANNLLGATPTNTNGIDVAGTIDGVLATGSGQILTGAVGSATEGMKLLINGGAIGARGTVNFSQGYGFKLNQLVDTYVSSTGSISSSTDSLNRSITDIQNQTTTLNASLVDIEARYRAQFNALDLIVANMNSTQSYLTQQLAALATLK